MILAISKCFISNSLKKPVQQSIAAPALPYLVCANLVHWIALFSMMAPLRKKSFFIVAAVSLSSVSALLFPRESETRVVKDLGGKWRFKIDDSPSRHRSMDENWWKSELPDSVDMPVPSSYNDITQNKSIRDFVGWAWYQRDFFVPKAWAEEKVWLRIGSAHYNSIVWVNTKQVVTHEGGHLPFEANIDVFLKYGELNSVTIAVNNTLTPYTLPPGTIEHKSVDQHYPPGYFVQNIQFDFFNYAGIHRPVQLYTTPKAFIKDIKLDVTCVPQMRLCTLKFNVQSSDFFFDYRRHGKINVYEDDLTVNVAVLDKKGNQVGTAEGHIGEMTFADPFLWWPIGLNETAGYLYTFAASIVDANGQLIDIYRLPFGFRTINVTDKDFLINGKPFYFLGFGKHEDWDIRGKGFDWANVIKDFNLLDWLGGNSFRTSHYPYSEEIMQLCDEKGIVVIDECPAVGLETDENFSNRTLLHHLQVLTELIHRDYNHPSVAVWSVANEPNSQMKISENYFKTVINHVKTLDPIRPVTVVCNQPYDKDLASAFVDVVSVNKYLGWYEDSGHPEVIQGKLGYYLSEWYKTRGKPVIITEWGAGTVAGLHQDPAVMFTEEYQEEVMDQHFKVFDTLKTDFLVGEMIWNFADFATAQGANRIQGNKKGVLTRQRQPKAGAFVLRDRYHKLRNQTLFRQP